MKAHIFKGFLAAPTAIFLLIGSQALEARQNDWPVLKGPYLGQKPPGMTPEVFAPGIVSTDDAPEGCICFSKDGRNVVFRRHFREKTEVFLSEQENGTWTQPQRAPFFIKQYSFGDFTFAPNELKLYFTSNRPLDEGEETRSGNLWVVENADNQWLEPRSLGNLVNSSLHESYPSVSKGKTLYFFRRYDADGGASEIFSSKLANSHYSEPIRLGKTINTKWDEWDPSISPDEKLLVFCSKKPSGLGEDDLYVSFRDENGRWQEAINLGDEINSSGSENRPFITADSKYLFYTSTAGGSRDVYWVDMDLVRNLN
jgi:hypothetical protein